MTYKSTVASAHTHSISLRTTIPLEICRQLRLARGDVLEWAIQKKKNKKIIVVRKLQ